jgi:hypothetical protein
VGPGTGAGAALTLFFIFFGGLSFLALKQIEECY